MNEVVTEIQGKEGIYILRKAYTYRKFIELNTLIICVDANEEIKEVRKC